MRVQIVSDLHLECDADEGEAFAQSLPRAGDVLVLAGDVTPLIALSRAERALGWFCSRFADVVYVPGNHEYFHSSPHKVTELLGLVATRWPNLHVLNPGRVTLGGVRFVGGTLWFPSAPDDDLFSPLMNDFRVISHFVPWVHETHDLHVRYFEQHVRAGDVVISHHLPHPRSVAPRFVGSALNRFFVADGLAPFVERSGARLWVHGHTHEPCDYEIQGTRVICNPRGYPGERKAPFNAHLTIDV